MKATKKTAGIATWIILAILLTSFVSALGVAPSTKVIGYEPGVKTMSFRIINNNKQDMTIALYAVDELAEYITLEDSVIEISASESEKTIYYQIDLPEGLEPGKREAGIVVAEMPKEGLGGNGDSQVSATTAVIAKVQVDVPYPGIYADAKLYITESNVGEQTTFTISLFNKGTETINPEATIIIKGPTNEEITRVDAGSTTIEAGKDGKLVANWKADVNPGTYVAEAVVNYNGKLIKPTKNFVVGNLHIGLGDLTVNSFRLGSIAKLDVELLSQWNQQIDNIYADMNVLDERGNLISDLKTSSISVLPYGEETISGYWDTNGIAIGDYDINVILHYEGKTTEKLYETVVGADSIIAKGTDSLSGQAISSKDSPSDFKMSFLIMIVLVLVAINIGIFFYFKKYLKKKK